MTTEIERGIDRFVRAGQLNLHYLEWGNQAYPPIILIHGLSGNAHNFDRLAPHLASKYLVLSSDVRGRGDSDWAKDGQYTIEVYAQDLEGLRAFLGFERISLIGTSMGAQISMCYAANYPQRVERAVLNDIGPEVPQSSEERVFSTLQQTPLHFRSVEDVMAYYRRNPFINQMNDEELHAYASHAVKPHPEGGLTWKMDPVVRKVSRNPNPEKAWLWIDKITAPVLLIRGSESDILSPEVAQRMVREMKDCRLVEVPGVGHAPTLVEPEALTAIKEFFNL